jgi:hypothetical protein
MNLKKLFSSVAIMATTVFGTPVAHADFQTDHAAQILSDQL